MKLVTSSAVVLVVAAAVGCFDGDTTRWSKFSSIEGGFVASFPCSPEATTRFVETSRSKQPYKAHIVSCSSKLNDYFVSFGDLPAQPDEKLTNLVLDGNVERFAADGMPLRVTTAFFFGFPGREAELRTGSVIHHIRTFIAGQRMYTIMIERKPGTGIDEQTRFFDSFVLMRQGPTPPSP